MRRIPGSDRSEIDGLIYRCGPGGRYYIDLRGFGGGREALIPAGQTYATRASLPLPPRRAARPGVGPLDAVRRTDAEGAGREGEPAMAAGAAPRGPGRAERAA